LKMVGFPTLMGSWPGPWIGSYCIRSCITDRPLPTRQFHWNRKKYGRTDVRTHVRTDGRTFETGFIRSTLSKSQPKKQSEEI